MKITKPLVSIGLLSYNRSKYLLESIKSLRAQSYKNLEIIISDDASTDDSKKIILKFAKIDNRIKTFFHKRNLGLVSNSNFVLQKAKGKYFVWASNDDLWHKDFIKILVTSLESDKTAVLAVPDYVLFRKEIKVVERLPLPKKLADYSLIKTYILKRPLLVWGLFRTKEMKEVGGFYQDNRPIYGGSDNITIFRLLFKGSLVHIKKPLFYKRDSGYAMIPNKILENLDFSNDIKHRIVRYLTYPLMFLLDSIYFLKKITKSKFTQLQKITLVLLTLRYLLIVNIELLIKSLKGIKAVARGLTKKHSNL